MAEAWFFRAYPCRPVPYPDECLSGYLLRLALESAQVQETEAAIAGMAAQARDPRERLLETLDEVL